MVVNVINEEARRLKRRLDSERLSSEDKEIMSSLLQKDMDDQVCSAACASSVNYCRDIMA